MTSDDLGTTRRMFFPPRVAQLTWSSDLPATVGSYADAIALPLTAAPRGPQILGAAYDADGRLIRESQRAKSNRAWAGNPEHHSTGPDDVKRVAGHTFFGGHLRHAFGHLLLEIVPRFWPAPDLRRADQIVLYGTRVADPRRSRLLAYEHEVLRALDVDPAKCLVMGEQALQFERLTVASATFWLKRGFSPELRRAFRTAGDTLAQAGAPPEPAASRVYFSRSRLGPGARRALNEEAIERIAEDAGFRVVHPQELPVRDQVRLVREAEVLAGCDGSALHLGAFALPGTTLLALDSRLVPNQFMVDQAAGLDAVHALVIDGAENSRTGDWMADLARVRSALAAALG